MSLIQSLRPGGKHGLSSKETRDPIGYAVAALSRLAQSDLLDRVGLRKQTEQVVFTTTRSGFKTITAASRQFAKAGKRGKPGARPAHAPRSGVFDLTPTEDEQMLVDVVTEFAAEVVRPVGGRGRRGVRGARGGAQGRPRDRAADPRRPRGARRDLRGALGDGRHAGRRGARPRRPGPRGRLAGAGLGRHRARAVGDRRPAADLPPGVHGRRRRRPPRIALTEPTVLFDVLSPSTTASAPTTASCSTA